MKIRVIECKSYWRNPLPNIGSRRQRLSSHAGPYRSPGSGCVYWPISGFSVDGTRIFLQVPSEPELELFAGSENRFYPGVFVFEITFYRNDRGEVDRMVGMENGVTYEAEKDP